MEEFGSLVRDSGGGAPARRAPRRTRQVVGVSIAMMVLGLLGLLVTWLLFSVLTDETDHGESVAAGYFVLCYVQFGLSATQILSGVFIWRGGRSWPRIAAMVICSLNLLGGVVTLFSGNIVQGLFGIVVNGALIQSLRKDDVYDWCHKPW